MKWVTVHRAFSAADAQLVQSRLDAAGILAQVSDEIASMSMEGYSLAAGGIRAKVPELGSRRSGSRARSGSFPNQSVWY
ncbi:MAG: hypothetical protein M2R45_04617 [Verrucomicrobia subdivision 3 bacterium]|nr:hypothetical protein [Limisphaerales bacterium]MCS1417320.1 hypothetical protein [Limisphaerales bacterium]